MSRKRAKLPRDPVVAEVESLSHEGRGVAHVEGKATFIEGALPGERVSFRYTRRRGRFDEGTVLEVLEPSPERAVPRCAHFGLCGGCSLQHLEPAAQLRHKQAALLEQLRHIGNAEPAEFYAPLTGPLWGYRHKARLAVKYVPKKGGVLVGFRERASPYVADLQRCEVLHPAVGGRLLALRALIGGLSVRDRVAQIEVAIGDGAPALVLRNLAPLEEQDEAQLRSFAAEHGLHFYLQPAGVDSVSALWPDPAPPLSYRLPEEQLEIVFRPTDFTQVNPAINGAMVQRALTLLQLRPADHLLDLFCGVGNFTLALARHAASVTGVEGEAALVARAAENARRNALDNVRFEIADLAEAQAAQVLAGRAFDKVLLDPPRSGALEIIRGLDFSGVRRVVYVSCNPATLARDAGELVHAHGFRLAGAGIMDMFPHTSHVEALATFER